MHTYQTNSGEVTVMSWVEYLTLKTKNMDTCKTEVQLAKEADKSQCLRNVARRKHSKSDLQFKGIIG